jgi:hypothetical protein
MIPRRMRLCIGAVVTLLAGCSTFVPAPPGPTPTAQAASDAWARVLNGQVNERGEVDFAALARRRDDLDTYVRHVAAVPLADLPDGAPRLAHMINAYNALSIYNVLQSGIPDTHAGWAKVRFFVLRRLEIGGAVMSLYAFENDVIRPYARARGDPRVHFALNCSARSCPVLPQQPFSAAALDGELERETRAFFARPQNFRVDADTRTVWLSELLRFYAEDFVPQPAASLLDYANRYAPRPAPADFELRFTPYDWTIANSRRRRRCGAGTTRPGSAVPPPRRTMGRRPRRDVPCRRRGTLRQRHRAGHRRWVVDRRALMCGG